MICTTMFLQNSIDNYSLRYFIYTIYNQIVSYFVPYLKYFFKITFFNLLVVMSKVEF